MSSAFATGAWRRDLTLSRPNSLYLDEVTPTVTPDALVDVSIACKLSDFLGAEMQVVSYCCE